ncbi:TPA: PAAR domain-containing protein [Enterobacter kobei]|uniref:PAAR domain-containing protein n=1 Tax=Enterobacter kobei TaxID=208224 RepID=UPI0028DEC2CA|nr:PAAR domain-containing protein [Enterobacter kobei]HDC4307839.1 PAAR domain-containing protein [Enterobacter kobei]
MAIGHFLFRGDKTACGGRILEGCPDHQFFQKDMACEGHQVTCGKHAGRFRIVGGLDSDDIHGKRVAGTLHSRSSCPCNSRFIPSIDDTYEFSTGSAKACTAQSDMVEFPVLPGPIADLQIDSFANTCKPEDNLLLNGVYIWTEITDAGHAFVSVHQDNSIYVYTYGRFGRRGPANLTGDGILIYFTGEDARGYYREELYKVNARVFRIDDASIVATRSFFEDLWLSGTKPKVTDKMGERTQRRGRVIDIYDLTGSNCTTHTVQAISEAGSRVFDTVYTSTTTQLSIEGEEDFAVPLSLQKYLVNKSRALNAMQVFEITNQFRELYPNVDNYTAGDENAMEKKLAEGAATLGSASGYSGGTVGGFLGGSHDINE